MSGDSGAHPLLEAKGLYAGYGRTSVLRDVSLVLPHGSVRTVLGANGAGKSTLLKTITGLISPTAGAITYRAYPEDLSAQTRWPAHRAVRLGIALVPEGRGILARMTVEENLRLGAPSGSREEILNKLEKTYEQFPVLGTRRRLLAGTLSGGEQQMLALARGLMSEPRLLLLDEPSLGLAPKVIAAVYETIGEISAAGTTILLIEQNVGRALKIASYGYVLDNGAVVTEGDADQLASDQSVRQAYLGA